MSKTFAERLVVLTNIGLLYYDEPKKNPRKIIPIIGSKVSIVTGEKFNKMIGASEPLFQISNGEDTTIFSAGTKEQRDVWVNLLLEVQKEYRYNISLVDVKNTVEVKKEEQKEESKEEENEDNNQISNM